MSWALFPVTVEASDCGGQFVERFSLDAELLAQHVQYVCYSILNTHSPSQRLGIHYFDLTSGKIYNTKQSMKSLIV